MVCTKAVQKEELERCKIHLHAAMSQLPRPLPPPVDLLRSRHIRELTVLREFILEALQSD